jgi:MFS family permease
MMGGVNNAQDYISTMGLGYTSIVDGEATPVITDSLRQGGIVSVYYLGTLVGALVGGVVGAWGVLGASLQCSAQNHIWMIFARLINGWGTGILNAIVPVWATETAEHTSRGQFIAIEFTLNILGVVVAYWME